MLPRIDFNFVLWTSRPSAGHTVFKESCKLWQCPSPRQSGGSPFFAGFLHHAGVDVAWKKEIPCLVVVVAAVAMSRSADSSNSHLACPVSGGAPGVLLLLLRGLRRHRGRLFWRGGSSLGEAFAALLFGPGLGLAMLGDARPLGRSHAAYDLKVDFASRESLRDPRLRPKA